MPAPTNANGLSLGRPVIDPTTDDTATLKELLAQHYVGAGYPCGARDGDDVYMAVYAQSDGGGGHILYGGNPTDPLNPHVLTVSAAGSATVIWQDEGSTVATYGTVSFEGAGVTVTDGGTKAIVTIPGGGGGGSSNSFETWSVSGGGSIVADSATDTATFTGGTGITITADSGADSLSFAIDTSEVAQVAFKFIEVSGQTTVEADSSADTLTLVAGSNMTITTSADTITFASTPDGVGYDEIQEEGSALTKRAKLNFIGTGVTAADDAGNSRTNVTFTGAVLSIVMVRTTIPAGTINGTAVTASPGVANNGATVLTESAGALSSSGVSVDAVNFSLTAITCSSTIPGLFVAYRTTWNGDDAAIIIGPFDMRNLPSFNSADVQVPYHAASSSSFLLGGGEC